MVYNVFTIVFAAISALSTIAAFATCYITYKTTRPCVDLKVLDKLNEGICPDSIFCTYEWKDNKRSIAVLHLRIVNNSPVIGTVTDMNLEYGGKQYPVESLFEENAFPEELDVTLWNNNSTAKLVTDITQVKDPIVISPYFCLSCFVRIPVFAYIDELPSIHAIFKYRVVGTRKEHTQPITLYRKSAKLSDITKNKK